MVWPLALAGRWGGGWGTVEERCASGWFEAGGMIGRERVDSRRAIGGLVALLYLGPFGRRRRGRRLAGSGVQVGTVQGNDE